MERDCYRCGSRIDETALFCPACKAPQIRVSNPSEGNRQALPGEESTGGGYPPFPADAGIHWGAFFRAAALLSPIPGFLTLVFFPIGLLVVFPLSLSSAMARYRRYHAGRLSGGQGARMGAFMGLLSFASLAVIFFAVLPWSRPIMIERVHEFAARNPDPQIQAQMLWFATPDGFVALAIFSLLFVLVCFLIVGMASGALLARSSKSPG
jgi:hypothetical protein